MNETSLKPNEPFDSEKEKLEYEKYKEIESKIIHKNEEVVMDYKTKDIITINIKNYNILIFIINFSTTLVFIRDNTSIKFKRDKH